MMRNIVWLFVCFRYKGTDLKFLFIYLINHIFVLECLEIGNALCDS